MFAPDISSARLYVGTMAISFCQLVGTYKYQDGVHPPIWLEERFKRHVLLGLTAVHYGDVSIGCDLAVNTSSPIMLSAVW
jgi:hypothetical protein